MELNLSNQAIDNFDAIRIEKILERIPNLDRLILNSNLISYLPREISRFRDLQYLHLKYNALTALPKELFYLKNLKELYLTKNHLTAIPPQIKNLKNLTHLNLRYNELTVFPKEFVKLDSLSSLILTHNLIEEIPQNFIELKSLRYLNIGYNPLKKIPKELLDSDKINILFTSKLENQNDEETIHFKPAKELKGNLREFFQAVQEFTQLNYKGSSLTIEEINKVNEIKIQGENSKEIASSFEQFINTYFEKELIGKDEESRYKIVKNLVIKQIVENKLDKALMILGAHFAEVEDNERFNQIVITRSELTRIKTYERVGTMPYDEGLRLKRIISKNILDLLDEMQ